MAKQLGYACINMHLRKQGIYTGRSMIRRTFDAKGLDYVSELCIANTKDLIKIIQWNEDNGIKVFRMSSDIYPWMSEYEFTDLPGYDELCVLLKQAGDLAQGYGQRLSFHPGQFTVLASPTQKTVEGAWNELNKSAQIMDLMGLPRTRMAKINIHVGGAYGNKETALVRFCNNFDKLSESAKSRLTVENDDKASMYSVQDLYTGVFQNTGIPIVFDYHHHKFCTGGLTEEQALKLAASTWGDVKPCTHYSESRRREQGLIVETFLKNSNIPMEKLSEYPTMEKLHKESQKIKVQAHSDLVVDEINDYGLDIDVVVEAKHKEIAVIGYLKKYKNSLHKVL
jgi:UV DNA damage endonuclease